MRIPVRFVVLSALALASVLFIPSRASAQVTAGTVAGRVIDAQGAAVPGASVEALGNETGLTRETVSDASGAFRLTALPAGTYTVRATLSGFSPAERRSVAVSVDTTTALDLTLDVARVSEQVNVTATTPLISTRTSSIGEIVDLNRIQGLPLNGRQFANLAAVVPGVGLGFHADVSKSSQYSPQISGGNGRNVNYIVDGGDNNDDTVGGLLQMFPLEAIQEFKLVTQRFDAEHGRSNGGVLNVVTKSGTNQVSGSWFTLLRDDALNAQTFTEKINNTPKQGYSRYQYGGSFGGPIRRNRLHYFGAYEGTRQDVMQVVNTQGVFAGDGVFPVELRDHLVTAKVSSPLSPSHYVAFRYGRNYNEQPNLASQTNARSSWATSTSRFDSFNANHNWLTTGATLNEFVFQYSRFRNDIPLDQPGPIIIFTNYFGGANASAPQATEQVKWQFRDDYSWSLTGRGVGHDIRTGINYIHEPRLFISTEQGKYGIYNLLTPDVNGPVASATVIGGNVSFNLPLEHYGLYVQDDWRVTNRLTLNLGVRWDYVDGLPIDQSNSRNFQVLQAAGRAGQLSAYPLLADFGQDARSDRDNVQPRLGVVYDLRGDGRDVLRGGWGVYTDYAYTGSNIILAALDALGGGGIVFQAVSNTGLVKTDGSFFQVSDPYTSIANPNAIADPSRPVAGEAASPLLEQPYTRQTTVGWEHALDSATTVSVDYARVEGRDINMRLRPNVRVNGRFILTDVGIQPNNQNFRVAVSKGESLYNAMILALRRRMSRRLDVNASYTLAKATSDVGTAYDEVAANVIQNVFEPFDAQQDAPSSRTDARHRVSLSAIVEAPFGIHVAPVFFYRSALPLHTFDGTDPNVDGQRNDKTALAYRYTGLNDDGTARFEEDGPCEVVNCSRRAKYSQLNLRISRTFPIAGSVRLEAIGEIFNLFDARNPSLPLTSQRTNTAGAPLSTFMRPNGFAGDIGQPEQRIGQLGFRLTF
jgi:hypothetical protein